MYNPTNEQCKAMFADIHSLNATDEQLKAMFADCPKVDKVPDMSAAKESLPMLETFKEELKLTGLK